MFFWQNTPFVQLPYENKLTIGKLICIWDSNYWTVNFYRCTMKHEISGYSLKAMIILLLIIHYFISLQIFSRHKWLHHFLILWSQVIWGWRVIGISGSLIWSKTLMELIFKSSGEFWWSPEGPVSQIHLPTSSLVPLGSFKVCSNPKERVGCRKQWEAAAPVHP